MIPSLGGNKRLLVTFTSGLSVGFLVTYILFYASGGLQNKPSRRKLLSQQFIPKAPHSNGETDAFVGPDKEQKWNDFDAENHHGE